MGRFTYEIMGELAKKQKVINIGYRKVMKLGDNAVIVVPKSLKQKLLGKHVAVMLIVDAEDLGET